MRGCLRTHWPAPAMSCSFADRVELPIEERLFSGLYLSGMAVPTPRSHVPIIGARQNSSGPNCRGIPKKSSVPSLQLHIVPLGFICCPTQSSDITRCWFTSLDYGRASEYFLFRPTGPFSLFMRFCNISNLIHHHH